LENLSLSKAGMTFPTKFESWIVINPLYLKTDLDDKLLLDFVETVAHETAHAIIFNWDIRWGHNDPHSEVTEYLYDYYQKSYDWKKLLKENQV
jgi:predicted SprT family Zn-dependent metalloprotease